MIYKSYSLILIDIGIRRDLSEKTASLKHMMELKIAGSVLFVAKDIHKN